MRIEKDSMGEMEVPDQALYGASTQRAVLNFNVSKRRFSKAFVQALAQIKKAAAKSNQELALLEGKKSEVIQRVADELIAGDLYEHFVVDLFQTGSGTSTNMNANEVIANRATQILGGKLGDKSQIHPNDHVNMSQSSNDVIPSSIHVALALAVKNQLFPALDKLAKALGQKKEQFSHVIKSGRTHLQDATPITLGQEFSGYEAQILQNIKRLESAFSGILELALGGTAVGTGINTHPEFADRAIRHLNQQTGLSFKQAENHFAAQASMDAVVSISGQFKTLACSLIKIANDLRWLAAGPRCSLAELRLPEIQPGSSIMPGKVNPVICESVMMVAAQVIGNDTCINVAGQHGNFELNTMLPVLADNVLESAELLAGVANNFVDRCIEGITADEERCREYAEASLATCTSLAPVIGYDQAANLAKQALKEKKKIKELVLEQKLLSADQVEKVLDLKAMTRPGL
jgi:fumarate hydratase, class II